MRSERRAARAQQQSRTRPARNVQVDFLRHHPVGDPVWEDADVLREVFGELFTSTCESRLAMGGQIYNHLKGRWALANGFVDERWGTPAYSALTKYLEDVDA